MLYPQAHCGGASRSPRAYDEYRQWWGYARRSAQQLIAGQLPPPIAVLGPVMGPDEHALLSATALYSRLYATTVAHTPMPPLMVGGFKAMVSAVTVAAIIEHQRRAAAEREAALRWRDEQPAGVIVTTERILCNTVQGLLSVYYNTVTEFYPDLQNWSLTVGFGPQFPPLRLQGPATAALNLWAGQAILGDGWTQDPRLKPLVR